MKQVELLTAGGRELGVGLSQADADIFATYLEELEKWNKKINLTAISGELDFVVKHILDSLAYLKGLDSTPGLKLLDMGSGAGFPALPIKIARPEIDVTLVESVGKKATFLRHIARTLKINATVIEARVESLPKQFHDAFDIVTARAFSDMKKAIAVGKPFLKNNGIIVLSRGPEEALNEQDMAGLHIQLKQRIALTLPFSDYERAIWVFCRMS